MDRRLIGQIDRPFAVIVFLIALLGLYNLMSAGQPLGAQLHYRHGMYLLFGMGMAIAVAFSIHYRNLEALAYPIFIVALGMLFATDMAGKMVNGSRRWLVLGPVTIQTSDVAKLAVVIIVARTFHLDRWEGELTLREIFRPMNVSRPLLLLVGVILVMLFGDALQAPALQRPFGKRHRNVARLREAKPVVKIGRAKVKGQVRLPYGGVASPHAEVVRVADNHYIVRDLGSEAGTFVNGEIVSGEQDLFHGDVLRFGLNQRSYLRFKARVQLIRPSLVWVALVATLWLISAFFLQLKRGGWDYRDIVAPIDVVALPCVMILIQPDLGTTLVVLLIAFTMILYVGLRPASLVALVTGSAAFGGVAWFTLLKPYQKERIMTFLNPTSDLAGAGYHQHQSLIAIGSGEMWGKGHGSGTQTQLSFLPEQQTDFIFSVWAEEQGFIGCLAVVILFSALILLSLRVATTARDRFGALLAVGITAMIFWHTVINMLMVLRLAPVVGVPLPLWSNGGSFVMTTMIGIGILQNVAMRRRLF